MIEGVRDARLDALRVLVNRRHLPASTRALLQRASCLGHRFDGATLSLAAEIPEERLRGELQISIDQELIAASGADFAFVHDRIEQAAYSSIPKGERESLHWKIGRRILETPGSRSGGKLFDVVNQLNLGAKQISTRGEALELAQLNAEAGRQAKATAAHPAALEYFERAIELLGDSGWREHYSLALDVHLQAAEEASLSGRYDRMDALAAPVRREARSPLDQFPLDRTEIRALTARGMLLDAKRHASANTASAPSPARWWSSSSSSGTLEVAK